MLWQENHNMFELQAKQNANVCFDGLNLSCPISNRPLPIDLAMNIIMFGTVALTVAGNILVIVSVTHFKHSNQLPHIILGSYRLSPWTSCNAV